MAFVHLHAHMEGSYSDSPLRHEEALDRVRALKMPAFACTDHGELAAVRPFARAAASRGVKPIVGMEAYFVPDAAENIRLRRNDRYHLLLLAKDARGWANLRLLASRSWQENCLMQKLGLVDWRLLEAHHEGILCCTGCLAGPVGYPFLDKKEDLAEGHLDRLRGIFGEDLYLELYRHGLPEEEIALEGLLALARRHGVPTVATNDCHYLAHEDWRLHDTLIKTRFGRVSDFELPNHEYHIKSEEEMRATGLPSDAYDRTIEIAERITLTPDEILGSPATVPLPETAPRVALLGDLRPMGLRQGWLDASAVAGIAKRERERVAEEIGAGDVRGAEKHAEALALARRLAEMVRKPAPDFSKCACAPDLAARVPLRQSEGIPVAMWNEAECAGAGAEIRAIDAAGDEAFARRVRAVRAYQEGLSCFHNRQTQTAERAYLRALEEDPSFSNARYELGRARYYAGNAARAREVLLDLRSRDPHFERLPHLDSYLGWCAIAAGDATAAREAFLASLAEKPIGGSYVGLAKAHIALGAIVDARRALEEFLEHHPEDRRAEEAKRILLDLTRAG